MSAEDIARAFVNHYYTTLDTNAAGLVGLYQPVSTLTFEGGKFVGPEQIVTKLLSIGRVQHNIPGITLDVQISLNDSALLIFVSGQLKIDENPPMQFAHTFQLVATGPGAYYVHNELFRLVLG